MPPKGISSQSYMPGPGALYAARLACRSLIWTHLFQFQVVARLIHGIVVIRCPKVTV